MAVKSLFHERTVFYLMWIFMYIGYGNVLTDFAPLCRKMSKKTGFCRTVLYGKILITGIAG